MKGHGSHRPGCLCKGLCPRPLRTHEVRKCAPLRLSRTGRGTVASSEAPTSTALPSCSATLSVTVATRADGPVPVTANADVVRRASLRGTASNGNPRTVSYVLACTLASRAASWPPTSPSICRVTVVARLATGTYWWVYHSASGPRTRSPSRVAGGARWSPSGTGTLKMRVRRLAIFGTFLRFRVARGYSRRTDNSNLQYPI